MSNYTVGDVRSAIEGLDDSQGVYGFIITIKDTDVEGKDGPRLITPVEWEQIITRADELSNWGSHSVWDGLWEILTDAKGEVIPFEEAE